MTPDINVLVAPSRADHVHHRVARRWLNVALSAAANGARFDVLRMVIAGFLRLVKHDRVFPDPTPIDRAVEFIEALLSAPGVDVLALGAEWPTRFGFEPAVHVSGVAGRGFPARSGSAIVQSSPLFISHRDSLNR